MNKHLRSLAALLLAFSLMICLGGCQEPDAPEDPAAPTAPVTESVDYAAKLQLDMNSDTVKQEVTVHTFVDGDTTHFNVPESLEQSGILKARYLAIDTPESTGKIEEYGKAASSFTREKLSKASSILIESDDAHWNLDSTGGRYLVWVWYRESEGEPYRNLNLEILQNGYAIASSTANNRYGDTCMSALAQARASKLHVFSGQPDPDFFYGDAIELTLRELRSNMESYNGSKVAFTGIISKHSGNGVYVESYDADTDLHYGIYIYYGFNLSGDGLDILSVGNEVRIVGTVSYYEVGGTYQVSGLSYRPMKPKDPDNIQKLSEGHQAAFVPTTADTFLNGTVEVTVAGETRHLPYADAVMDTTLEMKGLKVLDAYTTDNPDSSSQGAMTLFCESEEGLKVNVRTEVLRDAEDKVITQSAYVGKTIDVRGLAARFQEKPQIKVLSAKDITVR